MFVWFEINKLLFIFFSEISVVVGVVSSVITMTLLFKLLTLFEVLVKLSNGVDTLVKSFAFKVLFKFLLSSLLVLKTLKSLVLSLKKSCSVTSFLYSVTSEEGFVSEIV